MWDSVFFEKTENKRSLKPGWKHPGEICGYRRQILGTASPFSASQKGKPVLAARRQGRRCWKLLKRRKKEEPAGIFRRK